MTRKKFHSPSAHKGYIRKLMNLSSMKRNEKNRWTKLVPDMNTDELTEFQEILENEIRELADIYLKVLQRRQESRSFSLDSEVVNNRYIESSVQKYQGEEAVVEDFVSDENFQNSQNKEIGSVKKQLNILSHLVRGSNYISEEEKQSFLEVASNMPAHMIQDMQNIIIRDGLRRVREGSVGYIQNTVELLK